MPTQIVEYVHRIGLVGRAGREGYSMTCIAEEDLVMANGLVACLTESQQVVRSLLAEASTTMMHRNLAWAKINPGLVGPNAEPPPGNEGRRRLVGTG
ncbi:hypothetical protein N9L68_04295 [bacterium]|nr:hypothetical protein [bacterium]